AGIHAALAPEHLQEMPPLGYAFVAAAAIGGVLACALVARPDDPRISLLAGLFCLGQIATWVLFVSVHVPGFSGTPEGIETIALVSKAAELAGAALAFPLRFRTRSLISSQKDEGLRQRPFEEGFTAPSADAGHRSVTLSSSFERGPVALELCRCALDLAVASF